MVEIRQVERGIDFIVLLEFLYSIYPNQPIEQIIFNANRPKTENIAIAVDGEKIVGSCWCLDLKINEFEVGGIGGLAVDEKYRGQNIARDLVRSLIEENKNYKIYLAWTRAVDFFKKLGFDDFSYGIEKKIEDSTPMIFGITNAMKINAQNNKWERIKF